MIIPGHYIAFDFIIAFASKILYIPTNFTKNMPINKLREHRIYMIPTFYDNGVLKRFFHQIP